MKIGLFLKYQLMRHQAPSGQIATLFIVLIAVVFIFMAITINVGQVAKRKTIISNAADGAALAIGSNLGSISRTIVDKLNGKEEDCDVSLSNLGDYLISFALLFIDPVSGIISLLSSGYSNAIVEASQFKKYARKLSDKSSSTQVSESAIQYGIFLAAADPNTSLDDYDADEDGLTTDKVSDVSLWYDYHLDSELPENLPVFVNAKDALANWVGCRVLCMGGDAQVPSWSLRGTGLVPYLQYGPRGEGLEDIRSVEGFKDWLVKQEKNINLAANHYPGFKQTLGIILDSANFPLTNPGWRAAARQQVNDFYKRGDPFDALRTCYRDNISNDLLLPTWRSSCVYMTNSILNSPQIDSVDIFQWKLEMLSDTLSDVTRKSKTVKDATECPDKLWPTFDFIKNIAMAGEEGNVDDVVHIRPLVFGLLHEDNEPANQSPLDDWQYRLEELKRSLVTDLTPYEQLCHNNCDESSRQQADTTCSGRAAENCQSVCEDKADQICGGNGTGGQAYENCKTDPELNNICNTEADSICRNQCTEHHPSADFQLGGSIYDACAIYVPYRNNITRCRTATPVCTPVPDNVVCDSRYQCARDMDKCLFMTRFRYPGLGSYFWTATRPQTGPCPEADVGCAEMFDSGCYGSIDLPESCFAQQWYRCYDRELPASQCFEDEGGNCNWQTEFDNCILTDANYSNCLRIEYDECYEPERQRLYKICYDSCIAPYRAEIDAQQFLAKIIDRAMQNISAFKDNLSLFYNGSYANNGIWGANGPIQAYLDYLEEVKNSNKPYKAKYGWKDSQGWHFVRVTVGRFIVPGTEGSSKWLGIEQCVEITDPRGSVRVEVTRYDQSNEVGFAGSSGNKLWTFLNSLGQPGAPDRKVLEGQLQSSLRGVNDWRGIKGYLNPLVDDSLVDQLLDYYGVKSSATVNYSYKMQEIYIKGK